MFKRIFGLGFFVCLFLITKSEAKFTSEGIKYWSAPDHTRVVVALRGRTIPRVKFYKKTNTIVVYFRGRIKGLAKSKIKVNDSLISGIRLYRSGAYYKLLIRLKRRTNYRVFTLKRFKNRPFRIVVDVLQPQKVLIEEKKIRKLIAKKTKRERKFVIVIDPGHGGSDPGAIGLYGLREKDIVLDIAKRIKRYFDRDPRFAAFLTRTGDYYVPLTKRVEIAHDYNADLFISIHSNSAPRRKLSGIMAFVLSEKGVKSSLVKMLEDVENTEEMIKDIELKKSKRINSLVLKVTHDFSSIEGKKASEYILAYLNVMCRIKSRGIRKAGFVVLKNPGIPSLLLELGFLSNPHDARMLSRASFRESMAFCVYKGIRSYFIDKQNVVKLRERVYMVRKGDSLWRIARLYGVDMKSIIRVNKLKNKRIYPGMKLIIP